MNEKLKIVLMILTVLFILAFATAITSGLNNPINNNNSSCTTCSNNKIDLLTNLENKEKNKNKKKNNKNDTNIEHSLGKPEVKGDQICIPICIKRNQCNGNTTEKEKEQKQKKCKCVKICDGDEKKNKTKCIVNEDQALETLKNICVKGKKNLSPKEDKIVKLVEQYAKKKLNELTTEDLELLTNTLLKSDVENVE